MKENLEFNEDGFGYEPDTSFDTIDMLGQPCDECQKDLYDETTVNDEREGVLHCPKCNHEVLRFQPINDVMNKDKENMRNNDFYDEGFEKLNGYSGHSTQGDSRVFDDYTFDDKDHDAWMREFNYAFDNFHDLEDHKGYDKKPYVFDPKNPGYGCTTQHPPLTLHTTNGIREVYGSSCMNPNIKDADIYVSLDARAPLYAWEQPWEKTDKQHIRFVIPDRDVPNSPNQFNLCVDYVVNLIEQGKKVHVGCIAGHGRTGMFLSTVVQKMMPEYLANNHISAIDYVRDNYCSKVVETLPQVLFLVATQNVDIPKRETSEIATFNMIFEEQNQDTFEATVALEGFSALVDDIEMIEKQIQRRIRQNHAPLPTKLNLDKMNKRKEWKHNNKKFYKI